MKIRNDIRCCLHCFPVNPSVDDPASHSKLAQCTDPWPPLCSHHSCTVWSAMTSARLSTRTWSGTPRMNTKRRGRPTYQPWWLLWAHGRRLLRWVFYTQLEQTSIYNGPLRHLVIEALASLIFPNVIPPCFCRMTLACLRLHTSWATTLPVL